MEAYMLLFITFSFFFSSSPSLSLSQPDMKYSDCRPFPCGTVGNIIYPFWSDNSSRPPYCGNGRSEFQLNCPQHEHDFPSVRIGSQSFNVTQLDLIAHKMTLLRTDLFFDNCSSHFTNTSLSSTPPNLLRYDGPCVNVTLFYNCSQDYSIGGFKFPCQPRTSSTSNSNNSAFYSEYVVNDPRFPQLLKNCEHHVQVPLSPETDVYAEALLKAVRKGFGVQYNVDESCASCWESGGTCGSNDTSPFVCYCLDDAYHPLICSGYSGSSYPPDYYSLIRTGTGQISARNKIIVGVVTAAVASGAIGLLFLCICSRKIKSWRQSIGLCKTSKVDQNIEAFIRNHGFLALTRYKFADVKKMTNSFKDKLGEGGYGSVYKGQLFNGCPVAVKLLKASNKNGEDFINEVASISRTSHVNVVALLGFCFEGNKKALIYEFMPNGSLDKFIHNNVDKNSLSLTPRNLSQIAIGIARGLEYLHRGCNTRIIHFDIKPHNILLDESFCPKISDFGLAKLCPRKESIVSISKAKGTPGYVAPELMNRNIGGVSHKSDVYSYGMMLLNMVGENRNMNADDCTTEKYFPDWIYEKLERIGSKLGQDGANTVEENEIAKKLTIVGLWCIQTFPSQRPTISRVIEMLEGSLDSLEMPSKPVIPSPPRLEPEYSITANTTIENLGFQSSSQMLQEEH